MCCHSVLLTARPLFATFGGYPHCVGPVGPLPRERACSQSIQHRVEGFRGAVSLGAAASTRSRWLGAYVAPDMLNACRLLHHMLPAVVSECTFVVVIGNAVTSAVAKLLEAPSSSLGSLELTTLLGAPRNTCLWWSRAPRGHCNRYGGVGEVVGYSGRPDR